MSKTYKFLDLDALSGQPDALSGQPTAPEHANEPKETWPNECDIDWTAIRRRRVSDHKVDIFVRFHQEPPCFIGTIWELSDCYLADNPWAQGMKPCNSQEDAIRWLVGAKDQSDP